MAYKAENSIDKIVYRLYRNPVKSCLIMAKGNEELGTPTLAQWAEHPLPPSGWQHLWPRDWKEILRRHFFMF